MIDQGILNELAAHLNSRITKVVINGVYEITNFSEKAVTESTVAVNFLIPAADVSMVTLIEVKGPNIRVSSKPVNLPVISDTLMLETFEIEEATD
ncbi:ketopantoate hydroxymethyltransferase [Paenibacillus xylanexedens]|uniref:ketopantoate hydroxymethyltransferase n=1 Tax=Paenibacillus xylanexedens TaxID=528191 RepID=UPI001C8DFB72|nr:ketopantoate hydroxymethyltransferase [Paenibacillus xylanexedens]MBY0117842.1 ketopantoate hydroxymethyltransferase [Paenibacillus xylanexedens]